MYSLTSDARLTAVVPDAAAPNSRAIDYYDFSTDQHEELCCPNSVPEFDHWAEACAYSAFSGTPDAFCFLNNCRHCIAYVMSFLALASYILRDDARRSSIAHYFLGFIRNPKEISISEDCSNAIDGALGEGLWLSKATEVAWIGSYNEEPPKRFWILTIDLSRCGDDLKEAHARLTISEIRKFYDEEKVK